ncbi:hypothetical protein NMY22_g16121 [Coprinellus aureogranulatus]|nr:hypothetical protein NMY22_g16121 [Coprinellus aureogranulatus]
MLGEEDDSRHKGGGRHGASSHLFNGASHFTVPKQDIIQSGGDVTYIIYNGEVHHHHHHHHRYGDWATGFTAAAVVGLFGVPGHI